MSGVAKHLTRTCLWTTCFLGCDEDVSLLKPLKGRVCVCEGAWLCLMLVSCWIAAGDIFFGQSTILDRSASS